MTYPRPDEPGLNILKAIVNGFLAHPDLNDDGKFIWEDHFKLKRVCVSYPTWEIASKFGKPEKGVKKAEKLAGGADGKREVLYRDVSRAVSSTKVDMYGPSCDWLDKVENDMA
jgi:hypothetical protein